ncbi:MAG: hypothetical protein BHW44_06975 [Roseburia sp. 40_7]|nr:MAG: hypothetical protein BHW44_06975 [Roseburia sp. 40_7]
MKHRYQYLWKMACAAVVSMLLMASLTTYASQTGNKLKKAGKEIDELEQKKAAAEENVGNLKEQESGLKGELAGLNTQLSDVSAKINELEVKIADKQAELVQTKEDLQAAEQTKQQQYESMKLRIRFVYENGNANMRQNMWRRSINTTGRCFLSMKIPVCRSRKKKKQSKQSRQN